ncbi:hypothetical protein KTO58_24080 [Chitinophaga pendula]|uniref:hypothetical protein n=1 Tax=Chitinophaga TaxID=79328 RepID=UPI000BAEABE9|nr:MULTISPECIES: hypothetical protein [Chitinophaga]ASZ10326.1 hypothetical protein CK934_04680 [Chitinophaga sp. MD30]UCJ06711.1 hypothetical protein KTO58_24080 [Chitinophaga pendula]
MKGKPLLTSMFATGALLMLHTTLPAQGKTTIPLLPPHAVQGYLPAVMPASKVLLSPVAAAAPVYLLATPVGATDYYNQHFGFFCKREWKLEQRTGLPIKFRLGSYDHAQQQEGKR